MYEKTQHNDKEGVPKRASPPMCEGKHTRDSQIFTMKATLRQVIAAVFAISALTACQDYIPFWDGENYDKDLGHSADEFPDFSTTKDFNFNINYGKKGSRALINIYTEDPQYMGADGDMYIRDEAEFSTFLDESGRFKGKVVLPADTKKVWVYTSRPGLPELISEGVDDGDEVDVDGKIEKGSDDTSQPGFTPYDELEYNKDKPASEGYRFFDVVGESSEADIEENGGKSYTIWHAATRGADKYKTRDRMFSITNWIGQRFGRIKETHYFDADGLQHDVIDPEGTEPYDTQGLLKDFSDVVNKEHDPDVMGIDDIETIQQFLWNGRTTKPEGLQNRKFYKNLDTEDINIAIPKTYIDGGKVKTVDKAQVWMRFLGEGAFYCDGIGYYVYDTDNPPQSMDDIKAYYVVFPNTSCTAPYDVKENTFKGRTVPFITYRDRNGNWTTDENFGIKNTSPLPYTYSYEEYDPNEIDPDTGKKGTYKKKSVDRNTEAWNPKFVPFDINQRMQLLYHEFHYENGKIVTTKVSKYFPPGKTIVFFLVPFKNESNWSIPDPYVNDSGDEIVNKEHETFRMACNMDFFHSNWRINKPQTTDSPNRTYKEEDYDETTGEGITGTVKDEDGLPICRDNNGNTISKRHFIALNYGNFAVYGIEDGVDDSMGDVLFTIKTDPIGIVVNDDRTTIKPEMHATTTNHRTYAFEDIWPDGGDYDMNDVVIDHHHRMTFKRDGNGITTDDWITSIEDDFIPIQPKGSADYVDAFGFQIPMSRWEGEENLKIERDGEPYNGYFIEYEDVKDKETGSTEGEDVPAGTAEGDPDSNEGEGDGTDSGESGTEEDKKKEEKMVTIILFKNAKADEVRYHKFSVTRTFSTGFAESHNLHIAATQLEQDGKNVLNPFIISQSDKNMGEGRIEIHLPKHSPTKKGLALEGGSPPQYYVGKYENGEVFPFAVSVPKSAFSYPWGQHFTDLEKGEGVLISSREAYPDFEKWAKAVKAGTDENEITKYSGWYKYLGKSIDDKTTNDSDKTEGE